MQVNVIAVHNTIGDVKPLYAVIDDVKSRIAKIMSIEKCKGFTRFWCYFSEDDKLLPICFDGVHWWVE